jgi:hypothetical protein
MRSRLQSPELVALGFIEVTEHGRAVPLEGNFLHSEVVLCLRANGFAMVGRGYLLDAPHRLILTSGCGEAAAQEMATRCHSLPLVSDEGELTGARFDQLWEKDRVCNTASGRQIKPGTDPYCLCHQRQHSCCRSGTRIACVTEFR